MYKLSIVIPVYGKFNFTSACLNDLFRLPTDHEIIIVDNASEDGTINLANITRPNFVYIRNNENEGFGRACNRGFKAATGRAVMFLNNDIRVQGNYETWTEEVLSELTEDCLVGPTIGILNERFDFVKEADSFEGNHWYMSGWNITGLKESFQKLVREGDDGPFSSEFFCYFEDTDLSFRAKELEFDFKIKQLPVVHFGRVTSSSVGLSSLYLPSKQIFIEKWGKVTITN